MSVAVQCVECPSFYFPFNKEFSKREIWKTTATIGRPFEEARQSLKVLSRECSEANWDGYNALPITENTFEEARKIIELLPTSIPMPEILAEPGGEIGFEWRKGQKLIFVISVEGKYRINYAGIFGSNKIHGSEYFGEMLPSVVIENLRRLFYR